MKQFLVLFFAAVILGIFYLIVYLGAISAPPPAQQKPKPSSQNPQIFTSGSVVPQNEAALHFQIAGKLVSLPFKVGDNVEAGDTVAALDSTQAQEAVKTARANLKSAQSALDLVLDNIHLYQYGNGGFANIGSSNETQTQKTDREEAQAAVSAAQEALQSAGQTLSQYSLVAPFSGIISHEDVTSKDVNVTATTTFTVSDPTSAVFQVQVDDMDIANIQPGATAAVTLNGAKTARLRGYVSKIYPDTTTDSTYTVDIFVDGLLAQAKLGESGTALISPSPNSSVTVVPSWVVLGNRYVWVMEGNRLALKKVTLGDSRGGQTQIKGGLSAGDRVITDPKSIINREYLWL